MYIASIQYPLITYYIYIIQVTQLVQKTSFCFVFHIKVLTMCAKTVFLPFCHRFSRSGHRVRALSNYFWSCVCFQCKSPNNVCQNSLFAILSPVSAIRTSNACTQQLFFGLVFVFNIKVLIMCAKTVFLPFCHRFPRSGHRMRVLSNYFLVLCSFSI